MLEQRPAEAAGADLEDVAARLPFQLLHGVDDVTLEEVALHFTSVRVCDVLGDGVHPHGVVTECLLEGRPTSA